MTVTKISWGFPKLGGALLGVLVIRESYYLWGLNFGGPLFRTTPLALEGLGHERFLA